MTRTVKQLFDLTGQTALVTGGSRGLGLQMAHALGEAGARLMLSSRKASDLEEAVAELKAAGIEADYIAADCGQEEDIRRLARETVQKLGRVDILLNNAGASWGAAAEAHPGISLGQSHEFECPWLFHTGPRGCQPVHDSQPTWPNFERCVHSRLGRQPARNANHCLQHVQGCCGELYQGLGRRVGSIRHHSQRHLPRLFS